MRPITTMGSVWPASPNTVTSSGSYSLGVGEESLVEYREDPVCGPLITELVGSRRPKSARTAR